MKITILDIINQRILLDTLILDHVLIIHNTFLHSCKLNLNTLGFRSQRLNLVHSELQIPCQLFNQNCLSGSCLLHSTNLFRIHV